MRHNEVNMAKSEIWQWFDSFMRGVTFFHVAGLALLFFGGAWGDKGKFDGMGFHFTGTFAELAGFITFFRELAKSAIAAWRGRK